MKNIIIKAFMLSGCVALLSSCSENYWNNHELDGFEVPEITDEQSIEYTLTDDDYASIASNSTNKALAAASDNAAALKAVGTQHYFTEAVSARDYVPAFLASTSFPYFTLTDGSAVRLTYRTSVGQPAEVGKIAAASTYTLSTNDYVTVWGGNTEAFVKAFTPANPATAHLASLIKAKYPDAVSGDYVVVNYNVAQTEPEFQALAITPIKDVKLNETYTVKGVVSAVCAQGYMLSDDSSTILIYYGSSFDASAYQIGMGATVTGKGSCYNGGMQISPSLEEISGAPGMTYPDPVKLDGATIDEIYARYAAAASAKTGLFPTYCELTGTTISTGKYTNITVEDATVAIGSAYQATTATQEMFTKNETVTIKGYMMSASGGKYANILITEVNGTPTASSAPVSVPDPEPSPIDFEGTCALYTFNGSSWSVPSNAVVLTPADYTAMGQKYGNLENDLPELLIPVYLKNKYPYALADDVKYVGYKYYSGKNTFRCSAFTYNGSEWVIDDGIVTETSQFVRTGGKWMYDPNVTITLPAGKGIEISTLYYQTCVDWVAANIDKPTGATYVTSYGNNEYYSGTSAYQGNVDLRASAARAQYAAGYADMTDEQVVATMKKRFETQVMPAALAKIHSDAAPVPGLEVIYTINFSAYTGSTTAYVIRYKVTGPAKFEFMDCTWNN